MTMESFGGPQPQAKNESNEQKKLAVSHEDGIEVLENLEITEKNHEFAVKMAKIETAMKERSIALHLDKDTGEPKKGAKSEFDQLKEETIKETRNELTRPSKYVKGALIAGIGALAFEIGRQTGTMHHTDVDLALAISKDYHTVSNIVQGLEITEIGLYASSVALALRNTIKAISQEIKTRTASNQKVQRIVAMMAGGMGKGGARSVVRTETDKRLGYESAASKYQQYAEYTGPWLLGTWDDASKEQIKSVRAQLDEMGIKRISREKYQG